MPRITQSKINKVFSFSTGSWLNWSDEAPASKQLEEHYNSESEESQSIDSDDSSDFWYHWSPEIDRMIIARRAIYLTELETQIARDEVTFELSGKCFLDQRPLPDTKMKQFASIVLRDGLVDLDRIEKQIAEDEANLKPIPVKPPPVKVSIVNVLAPKQKDPLITYWKFPCRTLGKEPAVPKEPAGKAQRTNQFL